MKCPNCNKAISPDWSICPFCKYEPVKCDSPDCSPVWLPQSALFCPLCGRKLSKRHNSKKLSKSNEVLSDLLKKKTLSKIIYSLLAASK